MARRRVCQGVCRRAKNLRHDLTKDGRACIIKRPPDGGREGDATKRSAAQPHPPKGGEANADYISCEGLHSHDHD